MPSSPRTPRQRCHSEPVTDVTGVGIRSPRRRRGTPLASLTEGGVTAFGRDGGRDITRTHPRCASVGGNAHAVERSGTSTLGVHRPAHRASGVIPSQSADWHGNPFPSFMFSCLRRPLFFQRRKKRGKETPPKTTFLDFLARLRSPLILFVFTTRTLCHANFP